MDFAPAPFFSFSSLRPLNDFVLYTSVCPDKITTIDLHWRQLIGFTRPAAARALYSHVLFSRSMGMNPDLTTERE